MEDRNDTQFAEEDLWLFEDHGVEEPEGYYGQLVTSMDAADFEAQYPDSGYLNPMDSQYNNFF